MDRSGVSRAARPKKRKKRVRRKRGVAPTALTVSQFCERNQISPAHYYNIKAQGKGPREMSVGRSKRITLEAERDWQKECEQSAA